MKLYFSSVLEGNYGVSSLFSQFMAKLWLQQSPPDLKASIFEILTKYSYLFIGIHN